MRPAFGLLSLPTPASFMGKSYERAISFAEIYRGLRKSASGVRWKDSVATYTANGLKNAYKLRQSLLSSTYKIDPYQRFMIHEPKDREIVATRIKDRAFQRSLCDNVLYPEMTKGFIRDNCACLRGRGVDDALNRMKVHLRKYYRVHGTDGYVLKGDIRHYFASIPHDIAKAAICKRVTDADAAARACEIVDSFGGNAGVGLGSQVSQLIGLAVLDELDHFVKERLRAKHYVRYMDDFVIICEDRDVLNGWLREIRAKVETIGLTLNEKTRVFSLACGFRFLTWTFRLSSSGRVWMRVDPQRVTKEKRKLKRMARKNRDVAFLRESYVSWRANMCRGDTRQVLARMDTWFEQLIGGMEHGQLGSYNSAAHCTDDGNRAADCDDAGEAGGDGGLHCDDDGCGSVGDR